MTSKIKSPAFLVATGLVTLIIAHFILRWIMARSPFLAESYYDEAVTGEMALHILKGEHQLFFWGQPYMGVHGSLSQCRSYSTLSDLRRLPCDCLIP